MSSHTRTDLSRRAKRNIKLYPLLKVFNKRVFLPIIPIYYIEYIGFSIQEVGLLAGYYALVTVVFGLPTGYFADKFGRANALRMGAASLVVSTILYAGIATKEGVVIGILFEAIGFSFLNGAGESLVHDSLEVLNRQKDYSKILSRAQSIALVINAAFIALVPLTYAIDPRLPFLLGTVAFSILLMFEFMMQDVIKHYPKVRLQWKGLSGIVRLLHQNIVVFIAVILFGIVGAIYFSFDVVTIALRQLGMSPEHLGWVFAAASLVGALMGLVVHKLKQLSLQWYMVLDIAILTSVYAAGFTGNIWLLIVTATLSIGFWRYRRIIYQDHLLHRYKTAFKATMLSAMNTTESLSMMWVPVVTTAVVGSFGVINGFGLLGIGSLIVGALFIIFMSLAFRVRQDSSDASSV